MSGRVPSSRVEKKPRGAREKGPRDGVARPSVGLRFAVEPSAQTLLRALDLMKLRVEPGSAFVAYQGVALAEVLCVQEDRQVGRDNCVRWHGMSLQIPAQLHRQHYVKVTVLIRQYGDASLAIFDGPRCLARYDEHGQLPDEIKRRAA